MADITIINSGLLIKEHLIPIGPLTIVSVLEETGYEVEFRDYQGKKMPRRADPITFKEFCRTDSEIIGISVICNALPTVLSAVRLIKEENPEKVVILGGAGATDVGALIMQYFPVDFVVMGEGEHTIIELMQALKQGGEFKHIQGIIFRDQNQVIMTPSRERITDLSTVPLPAYHHIEFSDYDRIAPILTARGCPFHCKFCSSHSITGNKVVYRDFESILAEIKILAPYTDLIGFVDDTFIAKKKRALDIVDAMKAEGIEHKWTCNGKIPLMDKDLLKALNQRKCHMVFYGVESGSERILKAVDKGHTPELAREVINRSSQYIDYVRTSYIWGYPFESIDDFYLTIDSLYDDMITPNIISQASLLCPLPNASLYREHKEQIAFDMHVQSRAGGLPPNENLSDYPELIQLIIEYPEVFTAFYYFDHDEFAQKFKIIKNVDWIYSEEGKKKRGY